MSSAPLVTTSTGPRARVSTISVLFLSVAFLDELVYGLMSVAWPIMKRDWGLTLTQVGLLLTIPSVLATVIEPAVGIIGNGRHRRLVVLSGGFVFVSATVLLASSPNFVVACVALSALAPASGAFVGLSQATLMDRAPTARTLNMMRWTLVGGVAVLVAPLALLAAHSVSLTWRELFVFSAVLALAIVIALGNRWRREGQNDSYSAELSWAAVLGLLRRREVWFWMLMLMAGDLTTDVFSGFVALRLDAHYGQTWAIWGVFTWLFGMLVGNVWLLRKADGLIPSVTLRNSALLGAVALATFLAVDQLSVSLIALALLGLASSAWYPLVQAELYRVLGDNSSAVLVIGTALSLLMAFIPAALGALADAVGLDVALWFILVGPLAMLLAFWRGRVESDIGP